MVCPASMRDLRYATTLGCKNTRSHLLMRLRFLQPMQPHNLSTFHKSARVLVLVLASRLLRGIPIISGHPELDSGL